MARKLLSHYGLVDATIWRASLWTLRSILRIAYVRFAPIVDAVTDAEQLSKFLSTHERHSVSAILSLRNSGEFRYSSFPNLSLGILANSATLPF